MFSHLNKLVHKFAAKFEDPHGAAFADSMVHWLLRVDAQENLQNHGLSNSSGY